MLLYQKTNKKIKEWMSKTKVNSSIVPKLVLLEHKNLELNAYTDKGDPFGILEHKKLELPPRIIIEELNPK